MKKIFKNYYLFFILFIIFITKDSVYKMFTIKNNIYNTIRCNILEEDYNKLLEFSEINYIYESDYLNTVVIYKDIYNYMNEITIRGGKDKELTNNPVIYDNTLVGFISKVNKNDSIVRLLTSKDSRVSVKINNEVGVLEYNNGYLVVNNISNYANIKVGDYIYTSGLGSIKENIFIGEVKDIILSNKDLEKIVIVDYKLNIKDINYVTVIKETI